MPRQRGIFYYATFFELIKEHKPDSDKTDISFLRNSY